MMSLIEIQGYAVLWWAQLDYRDGRDMVFAAGSFSACVDYPGRMLHLLREHDTDDYRILARRSDQSLFVFQDATGLGFKAMVPARPLAPIAGVIAAGRMQCSFC
jgi:hypothetical protein